ncbi:MarR family transcriptional regulator [Nocardia rhamnosiphila]
MIPCPPFGGTSYTQEHRRVALRGRAVAAVIDRLEQAGYVARTRNPADRRRVLVGITDKAVSPGSVATRAACGSGSATDWRPPTPVGAGPGTSGGPFGRIRQGARRLSHKWRRWGGSRRGFPAV